MKQVKLAMFFLVFLTLLPMTLPVYAAPARYEYYNASDDDYWSTGGAVWYAQTFTVGATGHTITSVKILARRAGTPGTLTVGIRNTDVNSHPTGGDLTNGTINADTFTEDGAGLWYEITLTEYTLLANTKYAIVLRSGANYVCWRCDGSSPSYADGCRETSANSGGTWTTSTASDFMFEVWGNPLTPSGYAGKICGKTYTKFLGKSTIAKWCGTV